MLWRALKKMFTLWLSGLKCQYIIRKSYFKTKTLVTAGTNLWTLTQTANTRATNNLAGAKCAFCLVCSLKCLSRLFTVFQTFVLSLEQYALLQHFWLTGGIPIQKKIGFSVTNHFMMVVCVRSLAFWVLLILQTQSMACFKIQNLYPLTFSVEWKIFQITKQFKSAFFKLFCIE